MKEELKEKIIRVTEGVQAGAQVCSAIRSRLRGLRTPSSVPHCAMRAGRQGRTPRGARACQTPQCTPAQGTPAWGEEGPPSVSPHHRTCVCLCGFRGAHPRNPTSPAPGQASRAPSRGQRRSFLPGNPLSSGKSLKQTLFRAGQVGGDAQKGRRTFADAHFVLGDGVAIKRGADDTAQPPVAGSVEPIGSTAALVPLAGAHVAAAADALHDASRAAPRLLALGLVTGQADQRPGA